MPVPLVMVKFAPTFVHTPELLKVTGKPELEVAATEKLALKTALDGACVLTVIVWFIFCAVTDSVTCGAPL